MYIQEILQIIHSDGIEDNKLELLMQELNTNTFARYLVTFDLLPESLLKQCHDYKAGQVNQQAAEEQQEKDVHDAVFESGRSGTMNVLIYKYKEQYLNVTDLLNELREYIDSINRSLPEEQYKDLKEYLSWIDKNISSSSEQVKKEWVYSIKYFMSLQDPGEKRAVMGPLKESMNAYPYDAVPGRYSCMQGLTQRLLDSVRAGMNSHEIQESEHSSYQEYASHILHAFTSQEGKKLILSSLWYLLGGKEIMWEKKDGALYLLQYNGKGISDLDEGERQSALESLKIFISAHELERQVNEIALFLNGDMTLDVTSDEKSEEPAGESLLRRWWTNYRSMMERLESKHATLSGDSIKRQFCESMGIGDITKIKDKEKCLKDVIRSRLNVYDEERAINILERHKVPVDKTLQPVSKSGFEYFPICSFQCDEAVLNNALLIVNDNYRGKSDIASQLAERLCVTKVQLEASLLAVTGGLERLYQELIVTVESPTADRLYSEHELDQKIQIRVNESKQKAYAAFKHWSDNDFYDNLCVWEDVYDKTGDLLGIPYRQLSIDTIQQICLFVKNHESTVSLKTLGLFLSLAYGNMTLFKAIYEGIDSACFQWGKEDYNGHTLLHHAVDVGNAEGVRILVSNSDIDVNILSRDSSTTPLIMAAESGNIELINELLNCERIKLDACHHDGLTALMVASRWGHVEAVKRLLICPSIDVNARDTFFQCTSLILAAGAGHVGVVKELLKREDIKVNTPTEEVGTALIFASTKGHLEVVRELLDYPKIDINAVHDDVGMTALMMAAANGHTEIVGELLKYSDINVNRCERYRGTALIIAAKRGHADIVRGLLSIEDIDVNKVTYDSSSALMEAAANGHKDVVEDLLNHRGIQVNTINTSGNTALILAATYGYSDIVELLLSNGQVDAYVVNNYGENFLRSAIKGQHIEVIEKFLQCTRLEQIKVKKICQHELLGASSDGCIEVVRSLLRCKDIDVNVLDDSWYSKKTPLMYAADKNHLAVAQELLNHEEIDINFANATGYSALFCAVINNSVDVLKALLAHKELKIHMKYWGESLWTLAARHCDNDTLIAILNSQHITTELSQLYFIEAVKAGHELVVQEIAKKDSTVINYCSSDGSTALIDAVLSLGDHLGVLKELLKYENLEVNAQTPTLNATALMYALYWRKQDMVEELLSFEGIDVNLSDSYGDTPLMIAAIWGNAALVAKIQDKGGSVNVIALLKNISSIGNPFVAMLWIDKFLLQPCSVIGSMLNRLIDFVMRQLISPLKAFISKRVKFFKSQFNEFRDFLSGKLPNIIERSKAFLSTFFGPRAGGNSDANFENTSDREKRCDQNPPDTFLSRKSGG